MSIVLATARLEFREFVDVRARGCRGKWGGMEIGWVRFAMWLWQWLPGMIVGPTFSANETPVDLDRGGELGTGQSF